MSGLRPLREPALSVRGSLGVARLAGSKCHSRQRWISRPVAAAPSDRRECTEQNALNCSVAKQSLLGGRGPANQSQQVDRTDDADQDRPSRRDFPAEESDRADPEQHDPEQSREGGVMEGSGEAGE